MLRLRSPRLNMPVLPLVPDPPAEKSPLPAEKETASAEGPAEAVGFVSKSGGRDTPCQPAEPSIVPPSCEILGGSKEPRNGAALSRDGL
jgi:hypothetical protein